MMYQKKIKTLSIYVIFLFILCSLLVAKQKIPAKPSSDKISASNQYIPIKNYCLNNLNTPDLTVYVKLNPNDDRYFLMLLKEKLQSVFDNDKQLLFASKRISELQRWGKDLDWEAILTRYEKHILSYWNNINENDRQKTYPSLAILLESHHHLLEELVFKQSGDKDSNLNKIRYIDDLFIRLQGLKNIDVFHKSNVLCFPLQDIVEKEGYGIYDLSTYVENADYISNMRLLIGDNIYVPKILTTEVDSLKHVIFDNVNINQSISIKNVSIIEIPAVNQEFTSWSQSYNAKKQIFRYTKEITNIKPNIYKIKLSYRLNDQATLKIEKVATNYENKNYSQVLYQRTIYPHLDVSDFNDFLSIDGYESSENKIILAIESKTEIALNELSQFSISYTQIPQFDINAKKISNIPNAQLSAQKQNIFSKLQKITPVMSVLLVCIFFYLTFRFQKQIFNFVFSVHKKIVSFIKLVCKQNYILCRKYRFNLFILFIILFLLDIIFLHVKLMLFPLIIVCIWIYVLIGYRVESRINFVLAIVFLTFCPLILIVEKNDTAEILTTWVYLFLLIGIFHRIIEIKTNQKSNDLAEFYYEIRYKLKNNKLIFLSYNRTKKKIYRIINSIFNLHPKTIYDHIANLIKLSFIAVFVFVISFILFKIYQDIDFRFRTASLREARLSLDPKLELMEPTIAYKSIKLMFYGDNFGWNTDNKSKVMIDNEAVPFYEWTNAMIIVRIPQNWKEGIHYLWIEKPVFWQGKQIITKSEKKRLQLLPITDNFTASDEAYFDQLKTLRPETRRINGYD